MSDIALIVELTDENRETLAEIALSTYLDKQCQYYDYVFETLGDLKNAICAGWNENGGMKLACSKCFYAKYGG